MLHLMGNELDRAAIRAALLSPAVETPGSSEPNYQSNGEGTVRVQNFAHTPQGSPKLSERDLPLDTQLQNIRARLNNVETKWSVLGDVIREMQFTLKTIKQEQSANGKGFKF